MYFIYQKQINVASKYSYNTNDIIEWFKNYIDLQDAIEAHGKDITAKDIVDDIFCDPDEWYDDFIRKFDIEQEVIDNIERSDLSSQIEEVAKDKLLDYYTKYLEELKFEEW